MIRLFISDIGSEVLGSCYEGTEEAADMDVG